jgi:hypothetical protein
MLSKILLSVLFLFVCVSSLIAQSKDQETLTNCVSNLRQLMIDPDRAKLDELIADELSYGHSSGRVEDKSSFISSLVNGDSDFVTLEISDLIVNVIDNVAIVRHKLAAETNDKGKGNASIKLGVMLVWKKYKGKWKLIGRQAFKI